MVLDCQQIVIAQTTKITPQRQKVLRAICCAAMQKHQMLPKNLGCQFRKWKGIQLCIVLIKPDCGFSGYVLFSAYDIFLDSSSSQ